MNLVSVA